MCFNDGSRDRQPHSGSFRLGRKEWLEKLIDNSRRKTRTAVAYAHADLPIVHALGQDEDVARICAHDTQRFKCIDRQVHQHLQQLHAITHNHPSLRIHLCDQSDLSRRRIRPYDPKQVADDSAHADK